MSKYVFVYHAPAAPADAPQPSAEEMAQVTSAWMSWAGQVGDRMVDFGNPLTGGVSVTTAGSSPSTRDVAGYSIIEADSMDDALTLTKDHPHLNMPGGATIEIHEALPVPGM